MKELKTLHNAKNLVDALQVQSLLESEGIHYVSKNQHVQNLFGIGIFGTGFNVLTGQIEIKVFDEDLKKSKELLEANLKVSNPIEDEEFSIIQRYNQYLNTAVILGLFLPGINLIPLFLALKIKSQSIDKLGGNLRIFVSAFLGIVGLVIFYQFIAY